MTKQILTRSAEQKPVIRLARSGQLELSRPLVMGVLNVTPDSFSDGGQYFDADAAVERGLIMQAAGADILDIGGESTRPGAEPVDEAEEIRRVLPVIEAIRKQTDTAVISIDTYKAGVASAALEAGTDIVNDISALRFDTAMVEVLRRFSAPVVLMHMLGEPRTMQKKPNYDNCVREIGEFFDERVAFAESHGIDRSRLILDPGIGFGKRLADNLDILANLREFKRFGLPLLVGASRKRFIEMIHAGADRADDRLGGSIAAAVMAVANGADIVRVHDVAETVEALKVVQAIRTTR
ncbi:dihydropteroate synthase [candidate division GN15 bacterium]|nr:dihydropteroate synthase [candidate division GN15 bacterium]